MWDETGPNVCTTSFGTQRPTSPHFSNPRMLLSHQRDPFENPPGLPGPSGPHPLRFSKPRGLNPGHFQDNGGRPRFGFDSPLNQPGVQPLRQKAPLLPTPTEGFIRLPNHMVNLDQRRSQSPDTRKTSLPNEECKATNYGERKLLSETVSRGSPLDKHVIPGPSAHLPEERLLCEDDRKSRDGIHGREGSRGRPVSQEREFDRGAREQGRQSVSCRGRETERPMEDEAAKTNKVLVRATDERKKETTVDTATKQRDGDQKETKDDNVKLSNIPQETKESS